MIISRPHIRYALIITSILLFTVPTRSELHHREILNAKEDHALLAETSTLRWTVMKIIRLYQKFISPQYGDVCAFHPSCSHFGFQAIQHQGLIQGGLMTADRLLRCNKHAYGKYSYDNKTGKLSDPITDHILWNAHHENH